MMVQMRTEKVVGTYLHVTLSAVQWPAATASCPRSPRLMYESENCSTGCLCSQCLSLGSIEPRGPNKMRQQVSLPCCPSSGQ